MSSSAQPSNAHPSAKLGDIVGVVAKVLNEREVLITAGWANGIDAGMRFAVLSEMPEPVIDPRNGEQLESVDREKVRIEASIVRERSTICRTYQYKSYGGGALANLAGFDSFLTNIAPSKRTYETLRATDANRPAPLSEEESFVKIGDPVRLVSIQNLESI